MMARAHKKMDWMMLDIIQPGREPNQRVVNLWEETALKTRLVLLPELLYVFYTGVAHF